MHPLASDVSFAAPHAKHFLVETPSPLEEVGRGFHSINLQYRSKMTLGFCECGEDPPEEVIEARKRWREGWAEIKIINALK